MTSSQEEDEDWEIEGRARLEAADYRHAWFYVPEFRTIWQYLLFLPFGFVLMVVGSPVPWQDWSPQVPWMLVSVPVGVVAAWAYRNHWATVSCARVGPRQIVYRFDSEGLLVRSSDGTHRLTWDALSKSVETPQAFLVFFQNSQFFLVPKRSFSAPEAAALAELLATLPARPAGGRWLRVLAVWLLVCALVLTLFEVLGSR